MNLKTDQKRYRVFVDESYEAEKEDGKMANLWRYYELRGNFGILYPFSETELAVTITSSRIAQKATRKVLGWQVIQNGDDETTLKLQNKDFEAAVDLIRPRKRRLVSPETARRLAEMGFKALKPSPARESHE
jgi:hypothetical protein